MKNLILVLALTVGLLSTGMAAKPPRNINMQKHPNLAAAQRLAAQAYDKVVAAQKANEYDLGGHAKKAKELLEQVNTELKMAAEAANKK